MWFVLRMTFWLGVVFVLLPNVGSQHVPKSQYESRSVRTLGSVPIPPARPSQHTLRPTDLAPRGAALGQPTGRATSKAGVRECS
jgi:hypothetical protein